MLILGAFRFPKGDAAAKRVYGFGKYFRDENYDITYISWGDESKLGELAIYDGFKYVSVHEFNNGKGNIFFKIMKYLQMGSRTLNYLNKESLENVSVIIAYHGTSIFLIRLKVLCRKYNIKLILDCTEWYEYNDLAGGKYGIIALDNSFRMNIVNPIIGNLIVISSYLYDYYSNVENKIKIPFLINTENFNITNLEIETKNIKLLYVGNPGKKDKFDILFKAIHNFNKNNNRKFYLDIYGLTLDDYKKNISAKLANDINKKFISFKGRIDNSLVRKLYEKYHFSILLRPNERYAIAGFPTKLVESLSYSTPIIASNVGDINQYIKISSTGYLVNNLSEEELIKIFILILSLSNKEYSNMRKKSFETAKINFEYKNEKKLIDFINKENYTKEVNETII